MLRIEMLAAERGDCLWLSYGPDERSLRHVIIDAGPNQSTPEVIPELHRRIAELGGGKDCIGLLVVTHVDIDHIEGVVQLLLPDAAPRWFRDVWFNAFRHLGALGGEEGEQLSTLLQRSGARWNEAFDGGAVVVPDGTTALPTRKLRGGLELTVLSPTPESLAKLIPRWKKQCETAGLTPGKGAKPPKAIVEDGVLGGTLDDLAAATFKADPEPPNGSSIALLARYGDASILLGADAHVKVLKQTLPRLGPGPLELTAVKLPHHGSRKNLDLPLARMLRAKYWLFSSSGDRFSHPNAETVARVVTTQDRPTLCFNYTTDFTTPWKTHGERSRYRTKYPRAGGTGLVVDL